MKIKLFTHTDLDGVGCAIVAFHLFGRENVDVEYCDYHEIDEEVERFIVRGSVEAYAGTLITDISVNEEIAELIEETNAKKHTNIELVDHHGTALDLNKYEWAWVQTEDSHGKTSGTSMLFEMLTNGMAGYPKRLDEFAETVRRYDTWEWQTKYDDQDAKQLNDLLFILGRDRFVDRFVDDLSLSFTATEHLLLQLEQEAIDEYVEKKAETLFHLHMDELTFGIVFADRYQSELGNRLSWLFPECDLIAMINPDRSVSLRTDKDDVDVSTIAKQFGGGGHPKAAGMPVLDELAYDFASFIFEEE